MSVSELSSRTGRESTLRANCQGIPPLEARLESWMVDVLHDHSTELREAFEFYGSPMNVISTEPFVENIKQLNRVAADRRLSFRVFFARKANKCLSFVEAAKQIGSGIDVASDPECHQALNCGIPGADLVCTAAIKTFELVERCVRHGVTIVIDNRDEFRRVREIASFLRVPAMVALRVSGFEHHGAKLHSRFGFDIDEVVQLVGSELSQRGPGVICVGGLHFHLDGYSAKHRVSAIGHCLAAVDHLRSSGHDIRFLDIGGGLPMSYLDSEAQWNTFWNEHREALLHRRPPITYGNHGLGFISGEGEIHGRRNVYPYFQTPVRVAWFANILDSASPEGGSIADSLRRRALQLRCEPGRSVLDGCGFTITRVEFTKRHRSGDWFVGVAMNRTQCRTGSDDFLVDPLLLRCGEGQSDSHRSTEGYLVGAYCTESELILLRRLRFPHGVEPGDLVVLPNTAGYFMHFLESRSHQFPLATNVVFDGTKRSPFRLDTIETIDEVRRS